MRRRTGARAYQNFRIQRLLFRVAAGLIDPYNKPWLFPQALRIAEQAIRPVSDGGKIDYAPGVDPREICNLRYLTVIRERLSAALRPGEGPERFLPALDEYQPIGSTDGLNFNSPKDKCVPAAKSHLSHAVVDSGLERKICAVLDADDSNVEAWVKNHRLYLEIPYLYFGSTYRYRPDFVVRLTAASWCSSKAKATQRERRRKGHRRPPLGPGRQHLGRAGHLGPPHLLRRGHAERRPDHAPSTRHGDPVIITGSSQMRAPLI